MAQADFKGNHVNAGAGVYFNTTTNVHNASTLPSNMFLHPQLLIKACRDSNAPLAKELLDHMKPGDVNYADITDNMNTALHLATRSNRIELIEILLENRLIDVNARNTSGETPLLLAVGLGLTIIAACLANKPGVDLSAKDAAGQTPLMLAIAGEHLEMAQMLLSHPDIDTNVADTEGNTVLYRASRNGQTEAVRILLNNPKVDVNLLCNREESALIATLSHGAGHAEIFRLFLSHPNIDVNMPCGYTSVLQKASASGRVDVVQMLLERSDINVNVQERTGWTPLIVAANEGQANIVSMLLNHPGIDVNRQTIYDFTALIAAASRDHRGIVSMLLKHADINPNICDNDGCSPLRCASRYGHAEIVRALLEHPHTNPNILNKKGLSPLGVATNRQIEQMLIARGALKSPKDSDCCIA